MSEAESPRPLAGLHLELDLALAREGLKHRLELLDESGAELGGAHPQHDALRLAAPGPGPRRSELVLAGLERLRFRDHEAHLPTALVVDPCPDQDHPVEVDGLRRFSRGVTNEELDPALEVVQGGEHDIGAGSGPHSLALADDPADR